MEAIKRIDVLRKLCEENNLNIYEVARESNIPEATIQNWTRKNPKPFETEDKLLNTINRKIAEKSQNLTPAS